MSNYTPIVLYGPKDSLAHLDPNKAIKGVQLDAEFNAIATAVSTKLDNPVTNLDVTGTANNYGIKITGSPTVGQSFGMWIKAGTTTDPALIVTNTSSAPTFLVRGDGVLKAGPGQVDVTPTDASFAITFSGARVGAFTLRYFKMGPLVRVYTASGFLGNNSTTNLDIIITALPAAIRPTSTVTIPWTTYFPTTNQFNTIFQATITSGGVVTLDSGAPGLLSNNTDFGISAGQIFLEYFLQ